LGSSACGGYSSHSDRLKGEGGLSMHSDSVRGFGEVVREALRGEEIVDMMWTEQMVMGRGVL
jgi:hypothetical protein